MFRRSGDTMACSSAGVGRSGEHVPVRSRRLRQKRARDPVFVPVEIEGAAGSPAGPVISGAPSPTPRVPASMIEIVMSAGTVRVPTGVDAATLATVLATLRALA